MLEAPAARPRAAIRLASGASASRSMAVPGPRLSRRAAIPARAVLSAAAAVLSSAPTWLIRQAATVTRSAPRRRPAPVVVLLFVLVAAWLTDGAAPAPGAAQSAGSASGAPGVPAAETMLGSSQAGTPDGQVLDAQFAAIATSLLSGPFLADGTLMKPLAVESAFPGAMRGAVTIYAVQPGDTLTEIAARFRVSMMTLWWANSLTSKDVLHVGQQLRIPPVSGLLYTVREGDTLDSIAAVTHADVQAIRGFNGLTSDTILIGQLLMIPDGVGPPIPTPAPTPRPVVRVAAQPIPVAPAPSVQPLATMTGVASWMYYSGTAARLPRGTLLRICGKGSCILRRVTTWGPSASLANRIVDLAAEDFQAVCGCRLSTGLTVVRVDILPG